MGDLLSELEHVFFWGRVYKELYKGLYRGLFGSGFVILDGMRLVAGTNETFATKTEQIVEYLGHAMERMIKKNAEVGVNIRTYKSVWPMSFTGWAMPKV